MEPVEDVFAARADPLGEGADLVPAIGDKGQILIDLEALAFEMIDDAPLRLAIVAMHKANVPGFPILGYGSADNELEVLLSVAPVADVAAVEADDHTAFRDRQIRPIARIFPFHA